MKTALDILRMFLELAALAAMAIGIFVAAMSFAPPL